MITIHICLVCFIFYIYIHGVVNMTTVEFSQTAKDGTKLFFKQFTPTIQSKAIICLIHGLGDHSGWFRDIINYFNTNGIAVLTFDLRGHGKSEGKRGHISSYDILMDDIDLLLHKAESGYNNLPIFLYGHSFGGNQVLNYILRHHPKVSGVVATAPWLSLYSNPSKLKLNLVFLLSKIYPTFLVSNIVIEAALSHRQEIINAYSKDPLIHSFITAGLFSNAYKAGIWAIEHASEFDVPLLLLHGSADKITSPDASRTFAENVPHNLCTFKLFKGLYHSLHNEISNIEMFELIVNWVNTKIEFAIQEDLVV